MKLGESTHEKWHRLPTHNPTEDVADPDIGLPHPAWLCDFDAERDVYEKWEQISTDIRQCGYQKPGLERDVTV